MSFTKSIQMSKKEQILKGKTGIVTGATNGIGRVTAFALAELGAELFLVCRNREKGEVTRTEIMAKTGNDNIKLLLGNLASLGQVRSIASEFMQQERPLHLLVNNAGVFNTTRKITEDGIEEMFAVNHLAHFLLTNLLLDKLKASQGARVINVASGAHMLIKQINFADPNFQEGFKALKVYSHSKLANMLFTLEAAKRWADEELSVNAVDPGEVSTGLGRQNGWLGQALYWLMKPFIQSPEKGARTTIYACTSSDLFQVSGRFFRNCQMKNPKPWALDREAAERLWKLSEELTQ